MSKNRQQRSNAAQPSETVSDPSLTSEPVNDSEQPSSASEPVSDEQDIPIAWEDIYKIFTEILLKTTSKEKLLIFKNDIDTRLVNVEQKAVEELAANYKNNSPEFKKMFLAEIGATPKKPGKKATSTGDKQSRKKNPYHGYKDINIAGVDYKVALRINTEANDFWNTGNPKSKTWMKDLDAEQRRAKFGGLERLEKNPELLEEFARIPGAVLVKQADDTYKKYDGKPADAEQPTTAENAE